MNNGQGRNEGFSEIYREVKTLAPPSPLLGWLQKIFYFILFYLTISITYKTTYLTYYDKPDNFRQFVVSFAAERTTRFQSWNNGISAVVSIFIRSWIGVSRK